ncbi:protein-L-isoaspartate carboxylmethyltransferase [Homoserinibacter sp. YIM 151385]|uniref:protein-L-isoaspartate carboxylmethyltransferase n=1 Tax=Homoserinibacter sp. YIM 151385 TaxID=2985506 RepID=UPI0022F07B94|nr:protein-L-isoaspartate carboxylmethyltransferase [Homoserinibacter sp. YIM 151385]WBU37585.1 protein-L-isoaspartate carboxylmethyltransferase [Homoserinibacter sp. YIM 151385]
MPYRDHAVVSAWIDDYRALGHIGAAAIDVLEQDASAGPETGLIIVGLRTVTTVTYIHPVVRDRPEWVVTFEAREHDIDLTPAQTAQLAADLESVSRLCAYLQERTDAAAGDSAVA